MMSMFGALYMVGLDWLGRIPGPVRGVLILVVIMGFLVLAIESLQAASEANKIERCKERAYFYRTEWQYSKVLGRCFFKRGDEWQSWLTYSLEQ